MGRRTSTLWATAVCALVFFKACTGTHGASIHVGGTFGWGVPLTGVIDDIKAAVGDELVFHWEADTQNVVTLRERSCLNSENGIEVANASTGHAAIQLNKPGVFNFGSNLPGQCEAGVLVAATVLPANMTADELAAAADEADLHEMKHGLSNGTGHCDDIVKDPQDAAVRSISCYSPPIVLGPGEAANAFYHLPNPYPEDQLIAKISQKSNIVDEDGRDVPLSEVYLHHVFGSRDFVRGEGAEYRGTWNGPDAVAPYFAVINGSKFSSHGSRLMNIHTISTWGVPEDAVQRCTECWCTEDDESSRMRGVRGGGHCCSRDLCPSTVDLSLNRTYFLQYNVTYRIITPSDNMLIEPTILYMMDLVNGTIEYDIAAQLDPNTSMLSLTGPMDARCPQSQPYTLVSCFGHLHNGGTVMRMYNAASGELICSSTAKYGTAPREVVGDESGFLVGMSQDVLERPIMIEPGTMVRIEAEYNSSMDHFGVMALWFPTLAGFDESCPGTLAEGILPGSVFGPSYADMDNTAFGAFNGWIFPDPLDLPDEEIVVVQDEGPLLKTTQDVTAEDNDVSQIDAPEPKPKSWLAASMLAVVCAFAVAFFAVLAMIVIKHQRTRGLAYKPVPQRETTDEEHGERDGLRTFSLSSSDREP